MVNDYLSKLNNIISKPLTGFKDYKSEKGISEPFKFLLFSSIIANVIYSIFGLFKGIGLTKFFALAIASIISQLILIFIISGIFHLLVKCFRRKNPYYQTFKSFAYISAFWIIGAIINGVASLATQLQSLKIINFIWIIGVFILFAYYLKCYTELSKWKTIITILILYLIILFIIIYFIKEGLPHPKPARGVILPFP